MRHPSKNRSLFASLVLCGPLLAVGCTNSDSIGSGGDRGGGRGSGGGWGGSSGGGSGGRRDGGTAGKLDAAQADTNPLCETLTCFSACQEQIAIAPIDQPMGFVPVPSPSYVYETRPLGSDMVLTIGRSFAEVRKLSDLSLLGSAPLPATWYYPAASAVVGSTAFVRDGNANLAVLDLANPAAPRATAWWLSAGSPVGGWRGKLVLAAGGGVSFVDVSNPLAPVESFCLPGVGTAVISGDTLVSTRSDASSVFADVYHLEQSLSEPTPWASVKLLGWPLLMLLDGARLSTLVKPTLVLYDLGGNAPFEVARVTTTSRHIWDEGGFFFDESADGSSVTALDLRGALEPYSVAQVAGSECLDRLDARDASPAFVVSFWLPGARFSPDSPPPVGCPVEDPVSDARGVAALSPDGHTLLLPGGKGVGVFRDLDTGVDAMDKEAAVGIPDSLTWVGDRIVAIKNMYALDYMSSTATIYDAANPQTALATVGTLDLSTVWLGASGGRMIGFTPAPGYQSASSPTLSLFDPHAATVVSKSLGLPTSARYTGYLWNDKLVVFDSAEAIVFNLDGSEQGRVTLPSFIATAKIFLLADLGWFATTDVGEILRFDPTSFTVEVGVTGCVQCSLLGADSERVYVEARGPDALSPLAPPTSSAWEASSDYNNRTYAELRAYAVTKGSYPLVGRYPLTETSMGRRLLIGSKLALVGDGALILAAPP